MYKIFSEVFRNGPCLLPNFFLKMKLTCILLLLTFMQIRAATYAQKVSINAENASLSEVITQIVKQTGFNFFYNNVSLEGVKPITIKTTNEDLARVLDRCFVGQPLTYAIKNKAVLITRKIEKVSNVLSDRKISGKVTDDHGQPLPGVGIRVKNGTVATTSDASGNYAISVPDNAAVLVFSFIGFETREVTIGAESTLNISLKPDVKNLDDVVVVGYGTQKKINLTGSVSTINFDKQSMNTRAISNVSSAMAGLASGISVRQSNGLPRDNNDANITIRGVGTLNLGSAPLVLVDGQVADANSVSPNDVASISILKDAASAAIYGSRAANGVILITTKTGKNMNGKTDFTYNNYVGWKSPTLIPDWAYNTVDHMKLINMTLINSGSAAAYSDADIAEWEQGIKTDPISYPSTNWWDALIKRNLTQDHYISARGGNDRINFYTSMDYYKDDGMVDNSGFDRINFRNNLSYKVNDWLRLGTNATYIASNAEPVDVDDIFQWFRASSPSILPRHPDGRYGSPQLPGEVSTNNPLQSVQQQRGESKGTRFQGKIFGVVTPLAGLSVTASYSANILQQFTWGGSVPVDLWNFKTGTITDDNSKDTKVIRNNFQKYNRKIIDLYADYTKAFGKHHGHLLGGFNQEYYKTESFAGARQDLLSYDIPVINAATGEITSLTGNANDYALRSFFGRANYDYDNKYLFEVNMRYDGSSRFSPANGKRWGIFPSASVGWVVSRENFFKPLNNVVTDLKLKASYGILGNNGIGNYDWQNTYDVVKYPFNDIPTTALNYSAFGAGDITWEETAVTNIGIETRILKNIDLTLEYYNKLTDHILAKIPIPGTNGGITAPYVNSAKVKNSGFNVEAGYSQRIGKLNISTNLNFSYNKNKILSYKGNFIEGHDQNNTSAWTEGKPIGIFWVREVDHIIQTQQEVDDLVAAGYTFAPIKPGPGDFLYKNTNGDKAFDSNDRVLKGNPMPLYTYGGSVTLNYAGVDLSVYFDGVGKWDKYLNSSVYALTHNTGNFIYPTSYLNMWTPEHTNTNIPKVYNGSQVNNQVSDFYLHSAAYFKVRSLQLGYTIPTSVTKRLGLTKCRVFGNLENYFTSTKWPNLDPEMTRSTNDDASYPLGKIASFGLQVGF